MEEEQKPRIEAFYNMHQYVKLVPSAYNRDWMDKFHDRHPYRCLPLSIANTHGWDVLCPIPIEITWNGGTTVKDLTVRGMEPLPHNIPLEHFVRSNFSRGIVTFHTTYLFRTPKNWSILTSGAFNHIKHGIAPLTGIIETDWLPYPFTMNWQMTEPGTVRFEKDEPFCMIMPIPKNYLEDWEVVVHKLEDDPVLKAEEDAFKEAREKFRIRQDAKDPEAVKQAWQRHYFVGRFPDGTPVKEHTNKLRLAEPKSMVGTKPIYAKERSESQMVEAARLGTMGTGGCPYHQATPADQEKWLSTSKLATFDHVHSNENTEARKRIIEGVLTPTPNTKYIIPSTDPQSLDFAFVPDFLTPNECKMLTETSIALSSLQAEKDIKDAYWQGRILFYEDIRKFNPVGANIMKDANERAIAHVKDFYQITAPLYADVLQLVQWKEGLFMPPHADGMRQDGKPHEFRHRAFGCIVYLNDDYYGGELYLTKLDTVIKPRAGMLVAFTGGFHHEHSVLKVHKGLRVTMPSFFTFEELKKDRTLYR